MCKKAEYVVEIIKKLYICWWESFVKALYPDANFQWHNIIGVSIESTLVLCDGVLNAGKRLNRDKNERVNGEFQTF